MILADFLKSLAQLLDDKQLRSILWRGVGFSILVLFGLSYGLLWLLDRLLPDSFTLPWIGEIGWIDDVLSGGAGIGLFVLSIFLMLPVASAITSLFLEDVAEAVERRHYPDLPPAPHQPFSEGLLDAAGFLLRLIGANILAFLLYLAFPPAAPIIFYLLNGYLLGREYFQIAALRRHGREGARQLRQRHSGSIWFAGCLLAVPMSVPILNLVMPVLGAATFTHLYNRLARREGSS